MVDVAGGIRRARHAAGLTQSQLAQRAGTSQPAVAAYENGSRSPAVSTFERLVAACGLRAEITLRTAENVSDRSGPVGRRLTERKRQVRAALARHGARNPRVFGSVARGEDTETSDLDLLVDLPRPSYVLLLAIERDVRDAFGGSVDVTTEELLREDVRGRVLDEAVPL